MAYTCNTRKENVEMKREFDASKPGGLKENWPEQLKIFSWIEYVTNVPYPILLITTNKENGKPNACLHSWGFFSGDEKGYYSVLSLLKSYHTYENIKRDREWCVNVPSRAHLDQCMRTIENNQIGADEIAESGFTPEASVVIDAPRIKDCPISLECRLEWDRSLSSEGYWHVFVGKIVHFSITDDLMDLDAGKRMETFDLMFSLRSQLNPLSGEMSPGIIGGFYPF